MRYASVMYLNPGCENEYKKRHDELWPELAEHLMQQGLENYYIHFDQKTNCLFASFDADQLDTQALAAHPVMQRWWEYMADIMQTKASSFEPVADPLREMFCFNLMTSERKRVVAVLDIGKTNIKICLMDSQSGALLHIAKTTNQVLDQPPYPHVNEALIWQWIQTTFRELSQQFEVNSIAITTHGATIACLSENKLAMPILDYEYQAIEELKEEYRQIRPLYSETYSPHLPLGLNLGAQLYWLQNKYPDSFSMVDSLLLYPQYWGYKFTGVKVSEVTSLGCHTDLWNPTSCQYSSLCDEQNWHHLFPDLLETGAKLGTILPELAEALGLPLNCVIFNGIHDSNASLVPYLGQPREKLTVISSGTWTVLATINGELDSLCEKKDMLANVDAFGRATPTMRFMGGREWEALRTSHPACSEDISFILEHGVMAMPSFAEGGGPFKERNGYIIDRDIELTEEQRSALADIYVALMTDYCLDEMDSSETVIVEGAFSNNAHFLTLLASMRVNNEIYASRDVTGTSGGAALLSNKGLKLKGRLSLVTQDVQLRPLLNLYRQQWRDLLKTKYH
ncbi:L-rhamnose mutarotase [Marinomonas sp. THO17]|uniref:L-rhamnose mutarotase n=1 Tax=Marinomonas sp. THO17 TaxID=3149048 RepID=UPI00336C2F4E